VTSRGRDSGAGLRGDGGMTELSELKLEAAGATDVGRVRASNEDAYGLCKGVFVVCDGMGGAAAGEVASGMTRDALLAALCEAGNGSDMQARLGEAIAAANAEVFGRGQREASLEGMGTTVVVLAVGAGGAWLGHVGDSRGYRLRAGRLERLTRDHSLVDEQVRLGQLTEEEAERSPLRNVITRAVGSQRTVTPEIEQVDVSPGDVVLLASDGLSREVADEEIGRMLAEAASAEEACRKLIDAANAHGGRDNVTCLVVRVGDRD
jgi:serine/threonine protein phosphatase PrpC